MRREKTLARLKRRGKSLLLAGLTSLKNDGIAVTIRKTKNILEARDNITVRQWAKVAFYTDEQLEEQRKEKFERNIKFSIITPLYNTNESFLKDMIDSVLDQTYPCWELCMADGSDDDHRYIQRICQEYAENDDRIKYRKLEKNLGIAGNSNACIDMTTGDYISILDHDDVLHPAALHDVMHSICEKNADFVYTDETTFAGSDKKDVIRIHFKPDYAPDNLLANNYICHFTTIKRSLLDRCDWFRDGFDGSQDHELFLRLTDVAEQIVHIPKELYLCRTHEDSVADAVEYKKYAVEAGKRAVKRFLDSKGIPAMVDIAKKGGTIYRVSYEIRDPQSLVSIIIPNYEHLDDLKCCISSIKEKTTYDNYEIIVVENNSRDPAIFKYYAQISKEANIRVITWSDTGFNWSALNNYAVREYAKGDYILLLNNDTEVISPDWIQEMLMYAQRSDVGAVGAMLYYPDDTIQHAGVIIGFGEVASHAFRNVKRGEYGYMERLLYAQNVSAVTGACMMMRRTVYDEVYGIDESFPVRYNDIDLCLRIREEGYLIVWTPYAELYHYESKSRGYDDNKNKKKAAQDEQNHFQKKWVKSLYNGDPYYNLNFSLHNRSFYLSIEEYERRKKLPK